MAAAAGKGGKAEKHKCPPMPWPLDPSGKNGNCKMTGPGIDVLPFSVQGAQIASGRFEKEIDERGRVWKVHPFV